MKPFDLVNDISYKKQNIFNDTESYPAYIVNKGFSYFIDTVFQSNQVNYYHHLDDRLQFDYLLNSIKRKRRFSKWVKQQKVEDLEAIQEYYGYNIKKAKDVVGILNDDQLTKIKKFKGGVNDS